MKTTPFGIRPPPPPPSSSRAVPPPPPRPAHGAIPVHSSFTAVKAPSQGVSPAFAAQVERTPTEQLNRLASQLRMEMVLARFTGSPARAAEAQKKLVYVEAQMHQRQMKQELVSRFQYQREVGGMSSEQLSGARSKETQALFVAQFRGDAAGVKEARAKLTILDNEMAKREHDLFAFQQSLGGMSSTQLEDLGSKLAAQFAEALFNPNTSGAQRDVVFNQLAMLIGEHVKRAVSGTSSSVASCFGTGMSDDARYSK